MYLLALLAIPLLIGIIGMAFSKGLLTPKELLVQEAVLLVLICGAYGISYGITRYSVLSDTEIWGGRIADKGHGTQGCCHSYPCNCHPVSCGKGCTTTVCSTCYLHSHDEWWNATTTNQEVVFSDGCNSPGSSPPARWNQIVIGEPTAVEHSFDNYVKANPGSILRRSGAAQKFVGKLPVYPQVFDYYRVKSFLFVGVKADAAMQKDLNARLNEINANLGARKQVNIVVVVAANADPMYAEGVSENWVGGKKNDVVVVIGAAAFPKMDFVQVLSWTKSEEMKLAIRDRIMNFSGSVFDGHKVLGIVSDEVNRKFARREWRDFEYLVDSIEPPTWALVLVFILGLGASIALTIYFWREDPFGNEPYRFRRRGIYGHW